MGTCGCRGQHNACGLNGRKRSTSRQWHALGPNDVSSIAASDCKTLAHRLPEFVCSPRPQLAMTTAHWSSLRVNDRVKDGLSRSLSNQASASIFKGFIAMWSHWHDIIDAPADLDKSKPPATSPCAQAGVCMCGDEGQKALRFLHRVDTKVKKWTVGKAARKELNRAQFALLLVAQAIDDPIPECAWDDGLIPGSEPVAISLFHIGAQLLSPWRSTFHELGGAALCAGTMAPTEEVMGAATGRFMDRFHFARNHNLSLRW